ncbi:MAG TPA: YbjN domain-containing protein [Candidatus Limnocylindrales bacterium]
MEPNGAARTPRREALPTAAPPPPTTPSAAQLESWLADVGITPGPRVERDGVVAWDVVLDGRLRRDLRTTLILDREIGLIAWAHLAPPIGDGLRKAYRTLLRWNDEFPLAKFSIAEDGRPILAVELPTRWLDADELGLALARIAGIADRLFDETRSWLWIGGRVPAGYGDGPVRTMALLERFGPHLPELFEG